MSIEITSVIWRGSPRKGSRLLMLLALGDNANDDAVCWPLIETLARKCRIKERAAQTILAHLQTSGDIFYQQARGRKHSNRFCIVSALRPDKARLVLKKWFGFSPKQIDAILKKVQNFAPIRADELDAKLRDKFEEQARHFAEKVQNRSKKSRGFAPRTVRNSKEPSRTVSEPAAAANTKRVRADNPVAATAVLTKGQLEMAESLYSIFGIEEPNASRIARMKHVTIDYVRAWRQFQRASETVKLEQGKDELGSGFYARQFLDGIKAPPPPATREDYENIPVRPNAARELAEFERHKQMRGDAHAP